MLNETVAVNLFGMNAEDVAKRNTAEREKNAAKARRKRNAAEKKAHKEKMAKAQLKNYDEIEVLANERAAWQENAYKASNLQLYAVLQKCYDLYVRTERKTEDATNLRKAIDAYAESKKYRFIGKGNAITRIVKCVFGADRRRVSAYSIVLRAVFKKHNGAADVAQFIKDNGGVEEIRLGAAKNAKTVKQKAADAVDSVVTADMGVVASEAIRQKLHTDKIGTQVVLIGTWLTDGSVAIGAVVESCTVVNAALASYYSSNKDAIVAHAAATHKVTGDVNMLINSIKAKQTDAVTEVV